MEIPRIFQILKPHRNILVAGCGGGYDVLSGLPLYFNLKKQGKEVYLANLSFSSLNQLTNKFYCTNCVKVNSQLQLKVKNNPSYFPEYYLSKWFKEKWHEEVSIYSFYREIGVKELTTTYKRIIAEHKIDAIVLVDGGTDSVTFGNEKLMGTPAEDHCSMAAVNAVSGVVKILACLGFGVDTFHGISHGLFLENTAKLEQVDGYLGCFSLSKTTTECQLYIEAYQAVAAHMQDSIVCTSIISAVQGYFGDHQVTKRTAGSELFINPLMSIYWTYSLDKVMEQIPYVPKLMNTKSMNEVGLVIQEHHSKQKHRERIQLPM